MRTIWIASAVFLVAAIASVVQDRAGTALIFAAIGFELIFCAESNIDWKQRITQRNWQRSIFEPQWQTTIVGKVSQFLALLCLFGFFVVKFR